MITQTTQEKTIECVKCHKQKEESKGIYIWGGSTYCCQDCCGDAAKAEAKPVENTCEFC